MATLCHQGLCEVQVIMERATKDTASSLAVLEYVLTDMTWGHCHVCGVVGGGVLLGVGRGPQFKSWCGVEFACGWRTDFREHEQKEDASGIVVLQGPQSTGRLGRHGLVCSGPRVDATSGADLVEKEPYTLHKPRVDGLLLCPWWCSIATNSRWPTWWKCNGNRTSTRARGTSSRVWTSCQSTPGGVR